MASLRTEPTINKYVDGGTGGPGSSTNVELMVPHTSYQMVRVTGRSIDSAGWEAHKAGKSRSESPYKDDTVADLLWVGGWYRRDRQALREAMHQIARSTDDHTGVYWQGAGLGFLRRSMNNIHVKAVGRLDASAL